MGSSAFKPLSPKRERFVAEYLKNPNATLAAIKAGYASKKHEDTGLAADDLC